ncbi:MAG: ShlB/FhaC/HecB family hemolysin secretion/activation protein [Phycisphaerales bacterium]
MSLSRRARLRAWGLVCRCVVGGVALCALWAPTALAHDETLIPDEPPAEQADASPPVDATAGDDVQGDEAPSDNTDAVAPPHAPDPAVDGNAFDVGSLEVRFFRDNPLHPSLDQIAALDVELGVTPEGYVAPREGVETQTMTIGQLGDGTVRRMYASAITRVLNRIVREFKARSIIGVFVAPDPNQMILLEGGQDYREAGDTGLTLVVYTARVTRVRSIASGQRINQEDRIDNPKHDWILRHSPVQAYEEGQPDEERKDLLRKDELDDYALRLNRHPGRRVDIAVAPAEGVGNAELQYLVQENKPWSVYFQLSNTGTESTNKWRERFGFQHTQLTNHDDILLVEYVTAAFKSSHLISGSYERRLRDSERLRWKIDANWNEFEASDVGILGETFTGTGWGVGGELIWNVFQKDEIFVDLVGGARFQHIEVTNPGIFMGEGEEDLFLPRVGVRAERYTETNGASASAVLEWSQSTLTNASARDMERLGRIAPDKDFAVLRVDATASTFLEPLIDRKAWEDATTPGSSTLAHEIVVSARGQYAFNNRLIPQQEAVLGGLYTVRGYDESVVAADTTLVLSGEYRFHVPRALAINPEPSAKAFGHRPFKWAPQQVYGRPDWDLVLRAFVDAGWSWNSKKLPFEHNESMLGAGIGAELLILRNFSARVDWAVALSDLDNGAGDKGDQRVHFVLTLLF